MKAMILAAGRGNRLRPITDHTPKPLIKVGGKPIIEYHLEKLAAIGIEETVINIAHLSHLIEDTLGDGNRFGVRIRYSREENGALETGGGIYNALPLLGNEPFMVINGDIFTDYPFQQLPQQLEGLAHVVLVNNPPHNLKGDFSLVHEPRHEKNLRTEKDPQQEKQYEYLSTAGSTKYTFAGINVYHPDLFRDCKPGNFGIIPLLINAMQAKQVTGEYYPGRFVDIGGKPENLAELQRDLAQQLR